ncbi:MAG TPA: cyclic nucleotide-binding domain-containing protein [Chthoniobacterales bacterium]|nr:cyclic nucleotide-binding domain-containing protein [Chthoniobacterales bacterium]
MNSSNLLRAVPPESFQARVELHPFLVGLRPHHLKFLADCAIATEFQPNEYLFRQGDFANRFYLIEEGNVALEMRGPKDHAVPIDQVGPGKLVGWSWVFPPYVWYFDARATERTTALFFSGTKLRQYCASDSAFGFELFKRMSHVMLERLQAARIQLLKCHLSRTR